MVDFTVHELLHSITEINVQYCQVFHVFLFCYKDFLMFVCLLCISLITHILLRFTLLSRTNAETSRGQISRRTLTGL